MAERMLEMHERFTYQKELEDQYNPRIEGGMRKYVTIESYDANGRCVSCLAYADQTHMLDELDEIYRNNEQILQDLGDEIDHSYYEEHGMHIQGNDILPQNYPVSYPFLPVEQPRQIGFMRKLLGRVIPKLLEWK